MRLCTLRVQSESRAKISSPARKLGSKSIECFFRLCRMLISKCRFADRDFARVQNHVTLVTSIENATISQKTSRLLQPGPYELSP